VLIAQQLPRGRQHPGPVTSHHRLERTFVMRFKAIDIIVFAMQGAD